MGRNKQIRDTARPINRLQEKLGEAWLREEKRRQASSPAQGYGPRWQDPPRVLRQWDRQNRVSRGEVVTASDLDPLQDFGFIHGYPPGVYGFICPGCQAARLGSGTSVKPCWCKK